MVAGGESSHIDNKKHKREVIHDVCSYNVKTNEWKQLKTSGEIVPARKAHCGALIGPFLIIYGGISALMRKLEDTIIFEINTSKWKKM